MHNRNLSLRFGSLTFALFVFFVALQPLQSSHAASAKDYWIYVTNDKAAEVKELLAKGFDPNSKSPNQQTGLLQAARDGSWQVFDLLLSSPKTNVNLAVASVSKASPKICNAVAREANFLCSIRPPNSVKNGSKRKPA